MMIWQTGVVLLELTFPKVDPIAFRIGPLSVRWYALMYLLSFLMGYLLMRYRLRKEPYRSITAPKPWGKTDVEDILLFSIIGVILGGRLGYVCFYRPGQYWADPISILYVWQGGMSFHGGLIGVVAGLAWFAWRRKRPFLQVTDLLVPAVGLALFAGRIGNFINGELWGRPAPESLPWAMRFPSGGDVLRHPSQLYQALLEGLLLFILVWWYARKPRYRGQVSGAFVFGYGVLRFIAEYYREPDDFLGLLGLGLSMGQWLCVPMILGGAAIWIWARMRALSDVEDEKKNRGSDTEEHKENSDTESPVDAAAADGAGKTEQQLPRRSAAAEHAEGDAQPRHTVDVVAGDAEQQGVSDAAGGDPGPRHTVGVVAGDAEPHGVSDAAGEEPKPKHIADTASEETERMEFPLLEAHGGSQPAASGADPLSDTTVGTQAIRPTDDAPSPRRAAAPE